MYESSVEESVDRLLEKADQNRVNVEASEESSAATSLMNHLGASEPLLKSSRLSDHCFHQALRKRVASTSQIKKFQCVMLSHSELSRLDSSAID